MGNTEAEVLKDVSRETSERLHHLVDLLLKWTPKINLVSRSTIPDLWIRHILDSMQLYDLIPETHEKYVDLGSGAGFPGLVIALMAHGIRPLHVTLVESDLRKATFLRTVLRETGVSANVISERIEEIDPLGADLISARALADLDTLFSLSHRHFACGGIGLFLKGANWKKEVTVARTQWSFSCISHTSRSDRNAVVLQIGELAHV